MKTASDETNSNQFYWYVTYQLSNGIGCIVIDTSQDWFPIQMSQKWIQANLNTSKAVVITGWIKISDQQFNEYCKDNDGPSNENR